MRMGYGTNSNKNEDSTAKIKNKTKNSAKAFFFGTLIYNSWPDSKDNVLLTLTSTASAKIHSNLPPFLPKRDHLRCR